MRSSVAGIAQLVEQLTCNQKVPSSTLGAGTKLKAPIVRLGLFHVLGLQAACIHKLDTIKQFHLLKVSNAS